MKATSAVLSPTDVPIFLGSGYAGLVDSVHVLSASYGFFVMDGATYQGVTTTPEPGSILLLSSGLLGMAGVLRRKPML